MESSASKAKSEQVAGLRVHRAGPNLRLSLALSRSGEVEGVSRLARVEPIAGAESLEKRIRAALDAFADQLVAHVVQEFGTQAPAPGAAHGPTH